MVFKWKIKGFDNYIVSKEGYVLRTNYKTNHLHYKESRFINFNKRNQLRLYRNNKLEYWSKKQITLEPIKEINIKTYSNLNLIPF